MTNKPKIKVINTNNEDISKMTVSKESEKDIRELYKEDIDKAKQEARKELIKNIKVWLDEFAVLINWHKERSLLPYDWHDYEHKKLIELRDMLKLNENKKTLSRKD